MNFMESTWSWILNSPYYWDSWMQEKTHLPPDSLISPYKNVETESITCTSGLNSAQWITVLGRLYAESIINTIRKKTQPGLWLTLLARHASQPPWLTFLRQIEAESIPSRSSLSSIPWLTLLRQIEAESIPSRRSLSSIPWLTQLLKIRAPSQCIGRFSRLTQANIFSADKVWPEWSALKLAGVKRAETTFLNLL